MTLIPFSAKADEDLHCVHAETPVQESNYTCSNKCLSQSQFNKHTSTGAQLGLSGNSEHASSWTVLEVFVEWDASNSGCYNVKAVLENAPKITVFSFFNLWVIQLGLYKEKNCQAVPQEMCTVKESLLKAVGTHLCIPVGKKQKVLLVCTSVIGKGRALMTLLNSSFSIKIVVTWKCNQTKLMAFL